MRASLRNGFQVRLHMQSGSKTSMTVPTRSCFPMAVLPSSGTLTPKVNCSPNRSLDNTVVTTGREHKGAAARSIRWTLALSHLRGVAAYGSVDKSGFCRCWAPYQRDVQRISPTLMANLFSLSDHPNLRRAALQLYADSRRQYRTRLKEVVPPASAVIIPSLELPAAGNHAHPDGKALLIRLPQDWEPYLDRLAGVAPQVVVHPDVGLGAQAGYLSWQLSVPEFPLPRALWLEISPVLELSAHNRGAEDCGVVRLVLIAGQTFTEAEFTAEPELVRQCHEALQNEAKKPDVSKVDLPKACQVATNYGERPWLFMRYDVRIDGRRVAVNWAAVPDRLPVCVL